jgi:hypothetical protein
MCSANIDQIRLRRAMRSPVVAQKVSSSGSQWSIQRPRRGGARRISMSGATSVVDPEVSVSVMGRMQPRRRFAAVAGM